MFKTHESLKCKLFNSLDGPVDRASASGAVVSGLIPSRVKPMTLKLVFTVSLLDAQQYRGSMGLRCEKNDLANFVPFFSNIYAVSLLFS